MARSSDRRSYRPGLYQARAISSASQRHDRAGPRRRQQVVDRPYNAAPSGAEQPGSYQQEADRRSSCAGRGFPRRKRPGRDAPVPVDAVTASGIRPGSGYFSRQCQASGRRASPRRAAFAAASPALLTADRRRDARRAREPRINVLQLNLALDATPRSRIGSGRTQENPCLMSRYNRNAWLCSDR